MNKNAITVQLVSTGFACINKSLDELRTYDETNPQQAQFAIFYVHTGVELLLKERLHREHWALVFKDHKRANEDTLRTGDFESISYSDLLTITASLFKHEIGNISILRDLGHARNRAAHFGYSVAKQDIVRLLYGTISSILDFVVDDPKHKEAWSDRVDELRSRLAEFKDFIDYRRSTVKKPDGKYAVTLPCPYCNSPTMTIDDGKCQCSVCRHAPDSAQLLDDFCHSFLGRGGGPKDMWIWDSDHRHTCPECAGDTFVCVSRLIDEHPRSPDSPSWVCFECGYFENQEAIDYCCDCGVPIFDDSKSCGSRCSECTEAFLKKD